MEAILLARYDDSQPHLFIEIIIYLYTPRSEIGEANFMRCFTESICAAQ